MCFHAHKGILPLFAIKIFEFMVDFLCDEKLATLNLIINLLIVSRNIFFVIGYTFMILPLYSP